MREGHAALDERIEIGRLEQRSAERPQTVGAMIVSMDVEDVDLRLVRCQQSTEWREQQGGEECEGVFHQGWLELDGCGWGRHSAFCFCFWLAFFAP